jgi:hypothetical protein
MDRYEKLTNEFGHKTRISVEEIHLRHETQTCLGFRISMSGLTSSGEQRITRMEGLELYKILGQLLKTDLT